MIKSAATRIVERLRYIRYIEYPVNLVLIVSKENDENVRKTWMWQNCLSHGGAQLSRQGESHSILFSSIPFLPVPLLSFRFGTRVASNVVRAG